mgnify:CR=1 FL=1
MSRAADPLDHAARSLARKHAVVRDLRRAHGKLEFSRPRHSAFVTLSRSIVGQQLAGAAAQTIWGRYAALFEGRVTPERTLRIKTADARGAGLSRAKWEALSALARAELDGELRLRGLHRLDDEAVRARLTTVRGIGPWTADMFLMFHLMRPDIWPVGDLGVRYGFGLAFGLEEPPTPKQLLALGDPYRPHRSALACYCWRALDASRA